MSWRRLLWFAVVLTGVAPPVAAQDGGTPTPGSLGPLRVRNMMFPAVISLGFVPAPAEVLGGGEVVFEFHYSHANVFVMSRNVREYLERRNRRSPLSAEDARSIFDELPGDAFYLDGETGVVNLVAHWGMGEGWAGSLLIPVYQYTGGFLDATIMDFHRAFGIGQAGKNLVANNQFQMLIKIGEDRLFIADRPARGSVGDPTFSVAYQFPDLTAEWKVGLAAAVKVPAGGPERFQSSGSVDYGLQFALQRRRGGSGLFVNAAYVWMGDFEIAPSLRPANVPSLTVAYARELSQHWSLVLNAVWSRSIWHSVVQKNPGNLQRDFATDEYQASLGWRYWRNGWGWGFAVTENLANFDNTPDIGFHLWSAFAVPPRSRRL